MNIDMQMRWECWQRAMRLYGLGAHQPQVASQIAFCCVTDTQRYFQAHWNPFASRVVSESFPLDVSEPQWI